MSEYTDVTPFAAAEIANRVLGVETGKTPRTPQMFYGYARNGSIASNFKTWTADGGRKSGYKVEFDGAAFMQYLQDQKAGKSTTASRHNYDELAAQFAITE
jgi:hypothetical protein